MPLVHGQTVNNRIPGEVRWSHAVNSLEKLERTLNSEVDMIESDIRISDSGTIIAAHPPALTSNLDFETLWEKVKTSKKGLKLDFKDPEVIFPVLELLKMNPLQSPLFLNADILQGNGANPSKWQPQAFVSLYQKYYPESILSVGWTTVADENKPYRLEEITPMIDLLTGIDRVTFPVRACLLPQSWEALCYLLDKNPQWTLTVWNNERVSPKLADWIQSQTDPRRTFYDLIDTQKEPLRLW